MGKSHIDITYILVIIVLINFTTQAANARNFASEGVVAYRFTKFNDGIKDSGPSPGGRGHGDTPPAQEFDWAGVDDSGPSPSGRGHDEPPPAQSFDWFGVKDSGPSHGGKGHNEPPSAQRMDWIVVKDSGPSRGGRGHNEPPSSY